ncbi:MAG: DSBA oxidoreductase [Rhodospirillaceae bacterium]|nr:MAG: DSBA oxidoreductase [Rhodospirillaceae bacterium]
MKKLQRLLAQGGIAVALLAGGEALAGEAGENVSGKNPLPTVTVSAAHLLEDRFLGKADAPLTVIDYSSLTCPHCADFHTQILPKLKAHYIDTGTVRFIYRDFPLEPIATAAAMLARCAPPEMYFRFLDALFGSQKTWSKAQKPREALVTLARLGGMTETDVAQCLDNQALLNGLTAMKNEAVQQHGIKATLSLVIGGRTHVGVGSYDALVTLIENALPKQ